MAVQEPPPQVREATTIAVTAAASDRAAPPNGLKRLAIVQNAPIARTDGGVLPFPATDIVGLTRVAAFPVLSPRPRAADSLFAHHFFRKPEDHFSKMTLS